MCQNIAVVCRIGFAISVGFICGHIVEIINGQIDPGQSGFHGTNRKQGLVASTTLAPVSFAAAITSFANGAGAEASFAMWNSLR